MAKNKQTKQFTELSDEELKQVTGGSLNASPAMGCDFAKCPELGKETDSETCECI